MRGFVEFMRSLGAARIAAMATVVLVGVFAFLVEDKLGVTMTEIIKAERN